MEGLCKYDENIKITFSLTSSRIMFSSCVWMMEQKMQRGSLSSICTWSANLLDVSGSEFLNHTPFLVVLIFLTLGNNFKLQSCIRTWNVFYRQHSAGCFYLLSFSRDSNRSHSSVFELRLVFLLVDTCKYVSESADAWICKVNTGDVILRELLRSWKP